MCGQLVTSGVIGYVGVATGTGETVREVRDAANELARKVVVPNIGYRVDIGDRLIEHDLARLQRLRDLRNVAKELRPTPFSDVR